MENVLFGNRKTFLTSWERVCVKSRESALRHFGSGHRSPSKSEPAWALITNQRQRGALITNQRQRGVGFLGFITKRCNRAVAGIL